MNQPWTQNFSSLCAIKIRNANRVNFQSHSLSCKSTKRQIKPIDNHKFQNVSTTAALSKHTVNKIYALEQVVPLQHLNFHPAANITSHADWKKVSGCAYARFIKQPRGHKSCADSFKCPAAVEYIHRSRPTHGTVVACISFSKCVQGG